ncbi:MAG: hypothetical protein ACK4RM_06170 [Flavobacterium sp.]
MKKRVLFLLGIFTLSLSLHSCGVIFGGSRYAGTIKVKDHPNAEIFVDGKKLGNGQASGLFPRNRPLIVEVKQEGCETKTQTFDKSFRTGNFILSTLTFGLIGIGVDLGTGASYKPAHKTDPDIQKMSDKDFVFEVQPPICKEK